MNILFHGYEFPPNGGGVGAYMRNMALALSGQGHKVFVITGKCNGLPEKEVTGGVTIYRKYDREDIGSSALINFVLDIAKTNEVDWIEGADYFGDCAGLLRKSDRPPVIIKIHTCNVLKTALYSHVLYPFQRLFIDISIWRNWSRYRDEKFCLENADLLFAPSGRVVKELRKQRLRLPKCISVVPNPLVISMQKELVDEESNPTILFVGRIDIGKGIQFLPKILKNLKEMDVKLWIAGGNSYAKGIGSLQSWLEKKFDNCGCKQNVEFLGNLEADELAGMYQRAWVVILPTRWDNFPTVVLEAMGYSKPVVTSPYGGMVEMLDQTLCATQDPGSPGFVEALIELLKDRSFRVQAGRSMRRKLELEYAPEIVAEKYIKTVKKALSL